MPCSAETSPLVSFQTLSCHPRSWGNWKHYHGCLLFHPPVEKDLNRLSFGRPCGAQTVLSRPLSLVERGVCAHTHTHTHTHKHTHMQSWVLTSRLKLLVPALSDASRRKRLDPKRLGIWRTDAFWAAWLWFCASWLSPSLSMREHAASGNNLIHCYNQTKCHWALQTWGGASRGPGSQR